MMLGDRGKETPLTPQEQIDRAIEIGRQHLRNRQLTSEEVKRIEEEAQQLFLPVTNPQVQDTLGKLVIARSFAYRGPEGVADMLDEARLVTRLIGFNPDSRYSLSRIILPRILAAVRTGELPLPQIEVPPSPNIFPMNP